MSRLLVSVRSAHEARLALEGGAGLIDVKDPTRGSLGRPEETTLQTVLDTVAGRRPVSAAWGELLEPDATHLPASHSQLTFLKWGLAGADSSPWRQQLIHLAGTVATSSATLVVPAAYADWERAKAPPPEEVCAFVLEQARLHPVAFLLDTWKKDGTTLLTWMDMPRLERICQSCRNAGAQVALAGSLRLEEIRQVRTLAPDWIAVRGAACHGGSRQADIDPDQVRRLAEMCEIE